MKSRILIHICVVLAASLAVGYAQSRIVIATAADILQLDPADIGDSPSSIVAGHIMEHLVEYNADGEIEGALAESWDVSEDGTVWTFHLRPAVTFQDGSELTSDVVKWDYDRILFDENAPTNWRQEFSVIQSVAAPDPLTVVMTLAESNAAFLDNVVMSNGGLIMSRQAFEAEGQEGFALHPVGTGPFRFKEWVPGQRVVLERNPSWWKGLAGSEELVFRPIPEVGTQVIELETGGVQVITAVGEEDWDRLQHNPDIVTYSTPAYQVRFLRLNDVAPLDDIRVRHALRYAVDYGAIVSALVGDLGTPSDSAIMPLASWGHVEGFTSKFSYDPEMARDLLEEAGWTVGADGMYQKAGHKLSITLRSPSGRWFQDKEIVSAIANQLQQMGIDADIQVMEWAPFRADEQSGAYQVTIGAWNRSSPEPSSFTNALLMTGARGNRGGWSDPALDDILTQAVETLDRAGREALYAEALERADELSWYIPLYNENKVAAVRADVEGYVHSAATTDYSGLKLR